MTTTKPRRPPQKAIDFSATAASLIADAKELVRKTRSVWDAVACDNDTTTATFETVVQPIVVDGNIRSETQQLLKFYASTYPSEALRDASKEARKILDDGQLEMDMRSDMYKLLNSIPTSSLEFEELHYLDKFVTRLRRNGVQLEGDVRRDFQLIQTRMQEVVSEYQQVLNGENGGYWMKPSELHGLPFKILDRFDKGEGSHEGSVWVSFKPPDYLAIMKFVKSSAVRKRFYYGNQNKCKQNESLLKELLLLREENARLLGYENHAAFQTSDKMVGSPQVVMDFLDTMKKQMRPRRDEELNKLWKLKNAHLSSIGGTAERLYLWDHMYYARLHGESTSKFDHDLLSEYFSLDRTLQGLMNIYEHMLGVKYERIQPADYDVLGLSADEQATWHEDVMIYTVWDNDKTQDFLGYIYLDLHPRDGKYTHAGHYTLQPGYERQDGIRRYPASALVLNLTPPTPTKPSLLPHEEIRRLFHELGHGMHSMVSQTRFARFHGPAVDRDFSEAPCMMLENFFWSARHMQEISQHYTYLSSDWQEAWSQNNPGEAQPPEKLPDNIVNALLAWRKEMSAITELTKLHHAYFDMTIHSPPDRTWLENTNFGELFNRSRRDILGLHGGEALGEGWDWAYGHTMFRGIANKYSAGYYTYLLGQVYSYDMWHSGFKANTMNKAQGLRFRYEILAKGGSQPEKKTLEGYLGRPASTRGFCEEFGIESLI